MSVPRIQFIDNSVSTLSAYLRSNLSWADEATIVSAFITSKGLDVVEVELKRAARKGAVRVLTGIYQNFTEPAALRRLLKIQEKVGGLSVRISTDPRFHMKLYLFRRRSSTRVVIGSSNVTADGLSASGEFNVVLPLRGTSTEARQIAGHVEDLWQHRSEPLTPDFIRDYSKKPRPRLLPASNPSVLLRRGKRTAAPRGDSGRMWIDFVTGYVTANTIRIVEDATAWGRRGWDWYCTRRHVMEIGDFVIRFNYADSMSTVRLQRIVDRRALSTPDGTYFVALTPERGAKELRLTPTRRAALKEAGLLITRAKPRRRAVSRQRWNEARAILQPRKRTRRSR